MTTETIRVVARIVAKPNKVDELKSLLSGLLEPTRKESGCISYQLLHNTSDPTDFTFVEEWVSNAALSAHFATPHVQLTLAAVPALLAAEPDIRQYQVLE